LSSNFDCLKTHTATRDSHASSSDENDCGPSVDVDVDVVDAWPSRAAGARVVEGGIR